MVPIPRPSRRLFPAAGTLGVLLALPLAAQTHPPADDYRSSYDALAAAEPLSDQVAAVRGLVLRRDAAELRLEEGRLWLLGPVNGRTVAAAFQGRGTFHLMPPTAMERSRLRAFRRDTAMHEPFRDAVFLFADSTLAELRRQLSFGPGERNDGLRSRWREALSYLGKPGDGSLDPDVLLPILNGATNDLFYAHMVDRGDPWVFFINPFETEGVQLRVRARQASFVRLTEVVAQFRRQGEDPLAAAGERRPEARISAYRLDITMTQDLAGDLRFHAAGEVDVTADTAVGPWVAFAIYEKVEVDSARWLDGTPARIFKAKDHYAILARLERPLGRGESATLRLWYRGNVIDRYGEWFFVNSSIAWYPVSMEGRARATFDLTFHHPRSLALASVGERVDSSLAGTVETVRWLTQAPIRNASFNIGIFDAYEVEEDSIPPVTLLSSEKGHRELYGGGGGFGGIRRRVGEDVAAALRFFRNVYGPPPVERFYATEIPWLHGEAFPGLINLSYATFRQNAPDGSDDVFRAHEVAHQWWGIGVDYATYHDRWISEGFSTFSGLWFLQTRRGENRQYFNTLEGYRADIMLRRNDPIPVWLGHRVATVSTPEDYDAIVYKKGAWVLHMLRMLTLDLQTMKEDRFTGIMREFYQTYRGRQASTEDFRRLVERHLNADMRWFFDQWIYRPEVPTYRVAWRSEPAGDGRFRVRLRVRQEQVPPDFLMYVPVTLDLGGDRRARVRVKVTGEVSEIDLPLMPAEPRSLRFNDMEAVLADVKTTGW